MNLFQQNPTAIISPCQKYRYELTRSWDPEKPELAFIMLNPSKADASVNDPTIKKICKIAAFNGYGSIWVYNLYAYRATDPMELQKVEDPFGPQNAFVFTKLLLLQYDICFAWGANRFAKDVAQRVMNFIPKAFCLHINNDGSPKHPLYCRNETKLIKYQ